MLRKESYLSLRSVCISLTSKLKVNRGPIYNLQKNVTFKKKYIYQLWVLKRGIKYGFKTLEQVESIIHVFKILWW